jgi:hypothetical protein
MSDGMTEMYMEEAATALQKQVGGSHYAEMAIQPIEFITANNLSFLEGNIIKYVCRHRNKNGADDIKKAMHYCELLLQMEYGE